MEEVRGHKETGRDERRQKRRLKTRGRGEEKKERKSRVEEESGSVFHPV